jgi:hypothetical protein
MGSAFGLEIGVGFAKCGQASVRRPAIRKETIARGFHGSNGSARIGQIREIRVLLLAASAARSLGRSVSEFALALKLRRKDFVGDLFTGQIQVRSNVTQNRGKGSDTDWIVARNRYVVFALLLCGKSYMATGLASDGATKCAQ